MVLWPVHNRGCKYPFEQQHRHWTVLGCCQIVLPANIAFTDRHYSVAGQHLELGGHVLALWPVHSTY